MSDAFTAELYVTIDHEDILLARGENVGPNYVGRLRRICEDSVEEMWIKEIHSDAE